MKSKKEIKKEIKRIEELVIINRKDYQNKKLSYEQFCFWSTLYVTQINVLKWTIDKYK